jgi:hypothetical protein
MSAEADYHFEDVRDGWASTKQSPFEDFRDFEDFAF